MHHFRPAIPSDLTALCDLVNSAYRGDSSRRGWTTEADLLGGQRADLEMLRSMIEPENYTIRLLIQGTPTAPGEILGCVHLKTFDGQSNGSEGEPLGMKSCYLGLLTTQPELQNQGLGRLI